MNKSATGSPVCLPYTN